MTAQAASNLQTAPGLVSAEWLAAGQSLPAHIAAHRWNGWVVPYFEFEAALRLTADMPGLSYDAARDVFVFKDEAADHDEPDLFEAMTLAVAAGPVKVYPIGAGSWTWELAEPTTGG